MSEQDKCTCPKPLKSVLEVCKWCSSEWEAKQERFYQLRNQGINRRSKPYPNAPEMHYPL